jgi:hypothetical protein
MNAAEEIARYFELLKSGAITEAEFTAAKATLLGQQTNSPSNTRGFAAIQTPPTPAANKSQTNNSKKAPKIQNNPHPFQVGAAAAAGVIGGRLISDKLLSNDDPIAFATETISFPDGDVISGAAVEMPNGDVFYSISDNFGSGIHSIDGMMTSDQVEALNNDFADNGVIDSSNVSHDDSGDSGDFEGFDFF